MSLLTIAEPGQSERPHEHRLAVGIDLGTTHSLVASVRNGSPTIIADESGRALLPSIVRYLADGSVETGYQASARQAEDPLNTIASVKRFMGRGYQDLSPLERSRYRMQDVPGPVRIETAAGPRSVAEISAEILKELRVRAENALGGSLAGAVLTVPAYFDESQRQATRDAARLAGLDVLRLLNEPTAAAVSYGLDRAAEGIYAVYDLGGGTFDISILRLSRGIFEVLSVNGDAALGGDDFDHRVYAWIQGQLGSTGALPPADQSRLLQAARAAKEQLSSEGTTSIRAAEASGRERELTLSRADLEEITADLVGKTLGPVRRALRDADLTADQVEGVVLVGGATRMPAIRRRVAEFFGRDPYTDLDPDQVVSLGAAIQANTLAGHRSDSDLVLLDVLPLSLGLETMGGLTERIIARNSTLPVARAQDFTTFRDGQTAMRIHVVQGEREVVKECRSLGHFELRGIPPMTAGAARIRVKFQVDADGLLNVSAREQSTGVEAAVRVQPSYGLTSDEISEMIRSANVHAKEDAQARTLNEHRVEGEGLLRAVAAALESLGEDDAELLSSDERSEVERAIEALTRALEGESSDTIREATENLNRATTPFAERRMDHAVQSSLAGRALTDVA